jgi:hypothetical protein
MPMALATVLVAAECPDVQGPRLSVIYDVRGDKAGGEEQNAPRQLTKEPETLAGSASTSGFVTLPALEEDGNGFIDHRQADARDPRRYFCECEDIEVSEKQKYAHDEAADDDAAYPSQLPRVQAAKEPSTMIEPMDRSV